MSTTQLHPRQRQVLEIVSMSIRGISSRDLANQIGVAQDSALLHLRALRKLGLIAPTKKVRGAVWASAARAKQLAELERDAEAARKRTAARAKRRQAKEDADIAAWLKPKHIRIRADKAPPLIVRAPSSVFALAQSFASMHGAA